MVSFEIFSCCFLIPSDAYLIAVLLFLCLLRLLPAFLQLPSSLFKTHCWHTSSPFLPLQGRGTRVPASATGGPGGERAHGDSGGEGGDVAGWVSAHPYPDQWGANSHPPGTAGPGWHRATSHGEQRVVELWKCVRRRLWMCVLKSFLMVQ